MGTSWASQRPAPDVDLSQKTAIVTGANTGIGYETAKTLAQMGAKVIIACRSETKVRDAIDRMKKEHNEERADKQKAKINIKADDLDVEFMPLDLASLQSTMAFIEAFKDKGLPLHLLICNAGIAFGGDVKTTDGFEIHFQVNYLAHTLLVLKLLPVLKSSGSNARIVYVSSMAYRNAAWTENNLESIGKDDLMKYSTTKLYQIMQMFTLSEKLEGSGIGVFSLHPGLVDTDISKRDGQGIPGYMKLMMRFSEAIGLPRTCFDGALTTLHAAANPEYDDQTALYLENSVPTKPLSRVQEDKEKQRTLWDYTLKCLKDYVTEETLKELTSST